jgi:hypothetical protein
MKHKVSLFAWGSLPLANGGYPTGGIAGVLL